MVSGMNNGKMVDFAISGNIIKLLSHESFITKKKMPISCQFILTNRCNLECVFCCNRHRDKTTQISKEMAFKALENLKELGCKGVEFTGGSEPTLHPNFIDIIEHCIKLGMLPALVTNGTLLKKIPRVLLVKFDWVRVSINASRRYYKKIHGADQYDRVIEGLRHIEDLPIPNKGISYIFCNETPLDDAQKLIEELQDLELDYFRFSLDVFNNPLVEKIHPRFKSEKLKIFYHSDRRLDIPEQCQIFYYKPVIDCNGLVYPCCTNLAKEIMPIGSVEEMVKIWQEKKVQIDTSKCFYCIYAESNNLISLLDKATIKNINFI